MPTYKISSDTLTQGKVTRSIFAETYPDALQLMDLIVDGLDGLFFNPDTDMPATATFDDLLAGKFGQYYTYCERYGSWQFVLRNGWFYTGKIGEETGKLCDVLSRIDPVMIYWNEK